MTKSNVMVLSTHAIEDRSLYQVFNRFFLTCKYVIRHLVFERSITYLIFEKVIIHLYGKMSAKRNYFEAFLQSRSQEHQIDSTGTETDRNPSSTSNNGEMNELLTSVVQ